MQPQSDRRQKIRAWRDQERARARLAFPLPDEQLAAFFAGVETQLRAQRGCFHDTRHARAAPTSLACAPAIIDQVLAWCAENGGFCDCEIVANTRPHWNECRTPRHRGPE
jgi:hypothetical protein